jgi:hypothetical protein
MKKILLSITFIVAAIQAYAQCTTPPQVFINATNTTVCSGESVFFISTVTNGGPNLTYQWKRNGNIIPGATNQTYFDYPASFFIYTLEVRNSLNCVAVSNDIVMTVLPRPNYSTFISGPATVNANQTNVTYSVSAQSGFNYNWSVPSGASIVSGQGTNSIVVNFGTSNGNVSVQESKSPCNPEITSLLVVVNPVTTSVSSTNGILNAALFPIPCESVIHIDLGATTGEVKYTIYEVTGNEIESGTFVYSGSPFELSAPAVAGTYLIKLETNSKTSVQRFVKK